MSFGNCDLFLSEINTGIIGLPSALAVNHSFLTQGDSEEFFDQMRRIVSDFESASAISFDQSSCISDLSRHTPNPFACKFFSIFPASFFSTHLVQPYLDKILKTLGKMKKL